MIVTVCLFDFFLADSLLQMLSVIGFLIFRQSSKLHFIDRPVVGAVSDLTHGTLYMAQAAIHRHSYEALASYGLD